jgi:Tfp pilus assembly protein PilO
MNTLFDKLSLRPQERRLVMVAMVVLFAVVNVWLIIPHFGEWKVVLEKLQKARVTIKTYSEENAKIPKYKDTLTNMQERGEFILPEDQAVTLLQTVQTEAATANIYVQKLSPAGGGAIPNNPFFEEQRVAMTAVAGEPELVDFLRKLGAGNSLVRIRDMDLRPDPSGVKLSVNLTIVGNYLKKPGAKPKPGTRPGTAPKRS